MAIPFISRSQVIGMIYVENRSVGGAFGPLDVELLSMFANQAATWQLRMHAGPNIGAATLRPHGRLSQAANDRLEQRNAELMILNSVGEAMAHQLDVETITRLVGDKVRRSLTSTRPPFASMIPKPG